MKLHNFFSVVPPIVRTGVKLFIPCAALAGLALGYFEPIIDHRPDDFLHVLRTMSLGLGLSVFLSCLLSCWILCLGFVYGDARRRAMRPVLWTFIAALIPHLLGFLLYFAMRRPIETTCGNCGGSNPMNQPFCSWCGIRRSAPPSDDAPREQRLA